MKKMENKYAIVNGHLCVINQQERILSFENKFIFDPISMFSIFLITFMNKVILQAISSTFVTRFSAVTNSINKKYRMMQKFCDIFLWEIFNRRKSHMVLAFIPTDTEFDSLQTIIE